MSSSAQHRQEPPHSPPADSPNPFFKELKELPQSFVDEPAENTDGTPTIISKNAPAEGPSSEANVKQEEQPLGDLRGRRLAHFELIEPIGVGGMAAVLRARDTQLERNVALKILPPDMAADPENVRRFHQEARAAARLDHETIARVFFCGEDQRLHFIAFEFVEGENLRTIIDKRGKLPVKDAIHYMLQIATGLAHAAERNVVHRDIKPSNIIITPDGRAKLVDMGLARSHEPHREKDLTQSGVTLGTFDYISPEQALEPREADVRSDIYSLGCTFYHALTGQAPVPEGTAAKKLHHHQHVAPLDPRQLNLYVPDSVAAILARMMAKDPRARYQRAEHLVQHLLQVAQDLGMPTDVPQGMLYVDAPLPSPPRKRPGLMIGLAVSGLVAAVIALSFTSSGADDIIWPAPPSLDLGNGPKTQKVTPPGPNNKKTFVPLSPKKIVVTTEDELKKALEQTHRKIWVELQEDVTLLAGDLVFQGLPDQELIIESDDPLSPRRITVLTAPNEESKEDVVAGLTIEGGKVQFSRIEFEIHADEVPTRLTAAVAVRQSGSVKFDRCSFRQTQRAIEVFPEPSLRDAPLNLASVAIVNEGRGGGTLPIVDFGQCFFERGQTAIALKGTAWISPTDCAFGPHEALFLLSGDNNPDNTKLTLKHCSALVVQGPVFRLDEEAGCLINAEYCLFTSPTFDPKNLQTLKSGNTALIYQTDATKPLVHYFGSHNRYHNLNYYWQRTDKHENASIHFPEFETELDQLKKNSGWKGEDENSEEVGSSPLRYDDPLKKLEVDPRLAFQVDPQIPELRYRSEVVGVESCVWGEIYDEEWWKATEPPMVATITKELIVDPSLEKGVLKPGYFRTLSAAIDESIDGGVILIKRDGLFPVESVRLNDNNRTITITPHQDSRPILTLDSEGAPPEAALFRIQRGRLIFKDLAFRLEPDRDEFFSQSMVALSGQGQCEFDNCVLTLKPKLFSFESPSASLYAVSFLDAPNPPPGADTSDWKAKIKLTNSLVRGEGTFLYFAEAQPYELYVDQSLVLLTGSFLQAPINHQLKGVTAVDGQIKLKRTTAFLTDYLLHLTDENQGGVIVTRVTADDCIFAGELNPLVQLVGLKNAERRKQLFSWAGAHNAYCGYETYLYQQPPDSGFPPLTYDKSKWQMNEVMDAGPGEMTRFLKGTFDFGLVGNREMAELQPQEVEKMRDHLQKIEPDKKAEQESLTMYGADLIQLRDLPLPPVTSLTESPTNGDTELEIPAP